MRVLATLPLMRRADEVARARRASREVVRRARRRTRCAAGIAIKLLKHPRFESARAAEAAGRRVWREAPVSLRLDDESGRPRSSTARSTSRTKREAGWVVVDFKTDIEIASAQDAYKQQVALYVEAVRRATGQARIRRPVARMRFPARRQDPGKVTLPGKRHLPGRICYETSLRLLRIEHRQPDRSIAKPLSRWEPCWRQRASASSTAAATSA